MSSVITSILSSTVGLLWNKARSTIAEKLKDGDVTDAQIRSIVVRELSDIKDMIGGLSRKDLLSSYSFFEEGVGLLNGSIEKSKVDEKKATQEGCCETASMPSAVQSGFWSEALELSQVMGKLKINSDKNFETANERFKEARKTATHAFCNESLSIKDRILAAKLRVVSEILENLESPETAKTGCLLFLKKLHGLLAIRELFSVYLNGGPKSLFNKEERVDNVKSVMLINQVLYHFVSKFSSKCDVFNWPTIELPSHNLNLILSWREVSTRKSMTGELTQLHDRLRLEERIKQDCAAINSHGEIVAGGIANDLTVISITGEIKTVELPNPREDKVTIKEIKSLAVDDQNNVYVLRWTQTRIENCVEERSVLYVLDRNYNVNHEHFLDFVGIGRLSYEKIAINKNYDIIMVQRGDAHVFVCDKTGNLKFKFKGNSPHLNHPTLSITDKNDIVIRSSGQEDVHIYTEKGELKSTIKVPGDHEVMNVAFHYVNCKIIVLTWVYKIHCYFVLCYSKTGKLENSSLFSERSDYEWSPKMISHPSGPIAVVRGPIITFL